jgi:hypothetical protein
LSLGRKRGIATVEWEASPTNDIIADSVIALIMHSQGSAASVRFTSQKCNHNKPDLVESNAKRTKEDTDIIETRMTLIGSILKERFSRVDTVLEGTKATFEAPAGDATTEVEDGQSFCVVQVDFQDGSSTEARITVECADENVTRNVQNMLQKAIRATTSISTDDHVD